MRAQKLIREAAAAKGTPAERWDSVFKDTAVPADVMVEVIAQLDRAKKYGEAVEAIMSAIRNNQGQSWMYAVLPLEMKLAEYPQEDIDRALLSRIDFTGGDVSQMLIGASLLSRLRSWDAAIDLCREATRRDAWRAEPWMMARSIADRSRNPQHILWSRIGILTHVWTSDSETLHREARQAIDDLLKQAEAQGPQELVSDIQEQLRDALTWDLRVRARWAGDGDVDLSVIEPGGSTCDRHNRVTKNGGLLSRMSSGGRTKLEEYRCQEAPQGEYEVVLRLIRGSVVTGNVVLQISRYIGSDHEQTRTLRVPVTVKDGRVKVPLKRGRG